MGVGVLLRIPLLLGLTYFFGFITIIVFVHLSFLSFDGIAERLGYQSSQQSYHNYF